MKIECEKAEKALGLTHATDIVILQIRLLTCSLRDISTPDLSKKYRDLEKKIQKAEADWEQYKKPGYYHNRPIVVTATLPDSVDDATIHVAFHKTGYLIRSGRNFIDYLFLESVSGNLRYGYVDLEHPITDEEKKKVLSELVQLNNGKLIGSQ